MKLRRGSLILLALAVIAGGAGAWFWWQHNHPGVEPPKIDLSGENDPALEAAIADARKQVLSQPRSAEAWGTLGEVLLANGIGEDSRVCFAEAARLDPKDPRWPYLHALAEQQINPDAAVPLFREAARRVEDQPAALASVVRWRYAEALIRKGERKEAGEVLRNILVDDPQNPRVLLDLGILAGTENNLEAAQGYLLRCADSPLTRQRARTRLASLFQQKGDAASAERYREKARGLPRDPEGPDPIAEEYKGLLIGRRARLLRAESLLRDGATADAVALLAKLLADYPDEAEASVKLGMALDELGRFRQAERVLRDSLARGGERVQAHYFLCVALFHQAEQSGNQAGFEEAAQQARRALAGKPDHAFAHLYLGLALGRLGQSAEGLRELEQAVRYGPDSTDPHLHLGEALVKAGRREEGFAHLDRAVELAGETDARPRELRERLGKEQPK